ncbi:uncharacterized protein LOC121377950 [Gigantopelta aegis]|uniref:uncharacterized protein LOC121377950 n=1 Tax=Gigantopelta aegis TaxID=1735272 RepID=UPI001B888B93|nr:uncharacterized protein LOC121377950 [Gigantopelta aegis]
MLGETVLNVPTFFTKSGNLEIEIKNETKNIIHIKDEYKANGEWVKTPNPTIIKPLTKSVLRLKCYQRMLQSIECCLAMQTENSNEMLCIGFGISTTGSVMSFIQFKKTSEGNKNEKPPQWASKKCNDKLPLRLVDCGYYVTCDKEPSTEENTEKLKFTIKKEILLVQIYNETDYKFSFKSRAANKLQFTEEDVDPHTQSIISLSSPMGYLGEVQFGITYNIKETRENLHIALKKTASDEYRTFIGVSERNDPSWGCRQCTSEVNKNVQICGFKLACTATDEQGLPYKTFAYIIKKESVHVIITNNTNSKLCFKSSTCDVESEKQKVEQDIDPQRRNIVPLSSILSGRSIVYPEKMGFGIKYEIEISNRCFYIGLEKTTTGRYKTSIQIADSKSPEWAIDECSFDTDKELEVDEYKLTCTMEKSDNLPDKTFIFTIEKAVSTKLSRSFISKMKDLFWKLTYFILS